AEVIFATAQIAEPGQVVNEQEKLRSLAGVGLLASGQLAGNGGEELRSVAPAANLDAVGQQCGEPVQNSRLRVIFGRAVEHVESCPRAGAGGGRGRVLGDEADDAAAVTPMAASSFWPTISRWLPPCRRKRAEVGSLMATGSPIQAWAERNDLGQSGRW